MFDDIATRYDLANTVMTLGQDRLWRRSAARAALGETRGAIALDCASGTGGMAAALLRAGALRVTGVDFSERMLAVARQRHPGVRFLLGDVLQLPFGACFDAATVAFGLRNLPDPLAALREMARVVRDGGRLAVLEAVRPGGGAGPLLDLAWALAPRVAGRLVGRRTAYRYLTDTVRAYATGEELAGWVRSSGWAAVRVERLGFGAVALVSGVRSPAS